MTDKQKLLIDVLDYVRQHHTYEQRGPLHVATIHLNGHDIQAGDNDDVAIAIHRVARKICQSTFLAGSIRRIIYPKQSSKTKSIA